MSSTETINRSSIELRTNVGVTEADVPDWQQSTAQSDADNVVEASRLADASVPEGGYGWVIVAACSTLCFWFGMLPLANAVRKQLTLF
jgi:hypothetical protein